MRLQKTCDVHGCLGQSVHGLLIQMMGVLPGPVGSPHSSFNSLNSARHERWGGGRGPGQTLNCLRLEPGEPHGVFLCGLCVVYKPLDFILLKCGSDLPYGGGVGSVSTSRRSSVEVVTMVEVTVSLSINTVQGRLLVV